MLNLLLKSYSDFFDVIVQTIVIKMEDRDPKVVIAACESIFNVIKNYRVVILQSRFFEKIFDMTIHLIGSQNAETRDFAKKVDEKIKDAVFSCISMR